MPARNWSSSTVGGYAQKLRVPSSPFFDQPVAARPPRRIITSPRSSHLVDYRLSMRPRPSQIQKICRGVGHEGADIAGRKPPSADLKAQTAPRASFRRSADFFSLFPSQAVGRDAGSIAACQRLRPRCAAKCAAGSGSAEWLLVSALAQQRPRVRVIPWTSQRICLEYPPMIGLLATFPTAQRRRRLILAPACGCHLRKARSAADGRE